MSAHQSSGLLLIITCFILMSGEVKTLLVPGNSDPCYNYTVLDQTWRGTNYSSYFFNRRCDQSYTWAGWYRLMYLGQDIRMPESCIDPYMCGTDGPIWMDGVHPQRQDGVVTRRMCSSWNGFCCNEESNPIRVKACQGSYYVYEFVTPTSCSLAYCADITTIKAPVDSQIEIKHLAELRIKLSSAMDFTQSSSSEIFLKQLKEDLVRKGFPANITLQLKSISKYTDVKLTTEKPEVC